MRAQTVISITEDSFVTHQVVIQTALWPLQKDNKPKYPLCASCGFNTRTQYSRNHWQDVSYTCLWNLLSECYWCDLAFNKINQRLRFLDFYISVKTCFQSIVTILEVILLWCVHWCELPELDSEVFRWTLSGINCPVTLLINHGETKMSAAWESPWTLQYPVKG